MSPLMDVAAVAMLAALWWVVHVARRLTHPTGRHRARTDDYVTASQWCPECTGTRDHYVLDNGAYECVASRHHTIQGDQ